MADGSEATHLTLRAARAYLGITMHHLDGLVKRGEVTGVTVKTESGHERVQLSIESLDAWKAQQPVPGEATKSVA